MKYIILIICCFIFSFKSQAQLKVKEKDLYNLYNTMIGFYSSEQQSKDDTSYFDIRLKMVPMWIDRDGYWLYVEQAMAGKEDKPYRQRVYQLSLKNDTTLESKVYIIKNGANYYGEWKYEKPLENLTIDSLEDRKGCSIYLQKIAKKEFTGSTNANDCESNLRGATYATSSVNIYDDMIISWDRGFDKDDKQVWGAENGGYIFIKEN